MTAIDATFGAVSFDRRRDPSQALLTAFTWGAALVFAACLVPYARPVVAPQIVAARLAAAPAPTPAPAKSAPNPYGALVNPVDGPVSPYGALVVFSPESKPASPDRLSSLLASLEAARPAPAAAILQPLVAPPPPKRDVAAIDETAPLPPRRPAELGSAAQPDRQSPQPSDNVARAVPRADDGNIFTKLFGLGRPSGAVVAYAAPESRTAGSARVGALAATDRAFGSSLFARSAPPAGYDKWTAVYDISARTVYLPDGTRLEAHSGLGDRLDDPRFVSERARGATPPHLYELEAREELFHGVQALRLNPVGDGDLFGRAGLLAHPFMLGPNGDSNGCVSIKDYDAFLRAYQQGQVKRLAVVAQLN